jgi:HAMP domain-containing protein
MDLIMVGTVIVLIIAGVWIGGLFAAPLRKMVGVVNELAAGKLFVEIPYTGKKDEVGDLAKAMEVFRNNMRETEKLKEEQELLKHKAELEKRAAMNKLADDFEGAVNSIVGGVAAKLIRYRFPRAIAQALEATAWWDWDHATLTARLPEFKDLRKFLAQYAP